MSLQYPSSNLEIPLADLSSRDFSLLEEMQRFGWYISEHEVLQTDFGLHELTSEASQEPSDLTLLTVDMTQRFKSVLVHHEIHFFCMGSIAMSLVLATAYICLPCEVPTDYYLYMFTHRALYEAFASLCLSSLAATSLRKNFKALEIVFVLILSITIDLLWTMYLLPTFVSRATWLTGMWFLLTTDLWAVLSHGGPWVLWFFYWAWHRADATVLFHITCLILTYYMYLVVLEDVYGNISQVDGNHWVQSCLFVIFLAWSTLCQRILQSLSRRIAIGIARVEGRPVQWYDLLRSQCFLFLAYTTQGAFYRLIFQ